MKKFLIINQKKGFLKGIEKFKAESNLTLNFSNALDIVIELKMLGFENSEIEYFTGKPLNECLVFRWILGRIKLKRCENIAKYIYSLGIKDYFISEVKRTFENSLKAKETINKLNEMEVKEKMNDLI